MKLDTIKVGIVKVVFGIGRAESVGLISLQIPLGTIEFYIIESETLLLFSLQDMNRLSVYYNNIIDAVVSFIAKYPYIRKFNYIILL